MSSLQIHNALRVATMDGQRREFTGGHIRFENGVITSVGPGPAPGPADRELDATGMVVLPGFVNTHHHLYQSLTRAIPRMQDQGLFDWLLNHYEVWRELDEDCVFAGAQLGLLELMKSGTTTSSDHHYLFPRQASPHLIDAQIRAARDLGLRFMPTRGSMSLGRSQGGLPPDDVVQTESEIRADTERLLAEYHDASPGAMTRLVLAPCSPFSVTSAEMRDTARFARQHGLRLHTHLAETLDEEAFCLKQFGQRPVAYVEGLDWLGEDAWFAHSVHLSDEEIARMGAAGAGVSHCPSSNMRLGSGIARIRELLQAGVAVSLGVDGSASNDSGNMLLELRNALLISRLRDPACWLGARDVLEMATIGGARVLGRDDIGSLAVGKRADIALFSLDGIEYSGAHSDPLAALVFCARQGSVDTLIVDGRIRIENGRSSLDEAELVLRHRRLSARMIERASRRTGVNFLMADERKEA